MKKTAVILLLVLAALACHRKTIAEKDIILSNKPTEKAEKKPAAPAADSGEASAQAKQGGIVYESRCGRCHGLKPVEKYTAQEWDNILKSMIPKARLNEAESVQVTAYVKAHAKK